MRVIKRNVIISTAILIIFGSMGNIFLASNLDSASSLEEPYTPRTEETVLETRTDPTLVAYWKFDEASGTQVSDQTANNNHGTLDVGTEGTDDPADAWVDGIDNGALYFDGKDDIVNCGNAPSLDINQEITIMAWVNCRIDLDKAIVSKHSAFDYGYMLKWKRHTGISLAIDAPPTSIYSREANINTYPNRWYHVAATFKEDIHLYIDGTPADGERHGTPPTSIGSSAEDLTIGLQPGSNGFNGSVDEVKIYNRALSAAEIREAFSEITQRGEWNLDDASGNSADDTSPEGNDGTLRDAVPGNEDGDTKPQWVEGIIGTGLQFDGIDDYVEMGDDPGLNFQDGEDFSISTWIKTTDPNGEILSKRNDDVYYLMRLSDGLLTCGLSSGPGGSMGLTTTAIQGRLNDDQWHYIVISVDRDSTTGLKIFVDGWFLLEGDPTVVGDLTNSKPLNIGRDSFSESNYFGGIIDQVEIWNCVFEERDAKNNFSEIASVAEVPPTVVEAIPDRSFAEDSTVNNLMNVTDYFEDIWNVPTDMSYTLIPVSDEDRIIGVLTNYTIAVSTGEVNWTGNETFKVEAENTKGLTTESNVFKIFVTGVNDDPVWTGTPPAIDMDEDVNHTTPYTLFDYTYDAEDDPLEFLLAYPMDILQINVTELGFINITPVEVDYHGDVVLNLSVREVGSTKSGYYMVIPITLNSVNDLARVVLETPLAGAIQPGSDVTLSWSVSDVDDDFSNITFDLYFGKDDSPPKEESRIRGRQYNKSGLDDFTKYYWKIVPSDGKDEGICASGVWNFTVDSLLHLPKIRLLSPENDAILNSTSINLSWEITANPKSATINYQILRGHSIDNLSKIGFSSDRKYVMDDLKPQTEYFWTVIPTYGDTDGICTSGIRRFVVPDIPFYGIELKQGEKTIRMYRDDTYTVNFTLTNIGNRELDLTINATGNLADEYIDFEEDVRLDAEGSRKIFITVTCPENETVTGYNFNIHVHYPLPPDDEIVTSFLAFNIIILEKDGKDPDNGDDDKEGFSKLVLPIGIGIVAVIFVGIALTMILVKMKQKKEDRFEAEKARKEEEKKKKEEEERARFQAQQDALAKDHSKWQRKDVDYSKFDKVNTEGWEEDYLEDVRKEMADAPEITDMLAGAGTIEMGGARPSFGPSLKIESAEEAVKLDTPSTPAQQPTTAPTAAPVATRPAAAQVAPASTMPRATTQPVAAPQTPMRPVQQPVAAVPRATAQPAAAPPAQMRPVQQPMAAVPRATAQPAAAPPAQMRPVQPPVSPVSPAPRASPTTPPAQQAGVPTKTDNKEAVDGKKDDKKNQDSIFDELQLDKW